MNVAESLILAFLRNEETGGISSATFEQTGAVCLVFVLLVVIGSPRFHASDMKYNALICLRATHTTILAYSST